MKKHSRDFVNYLIESKPMNAGEPISTANVIAIPKTIPTIMKRLFILKIPFNPVKNGLACNMRKNFRRRL